MINQKISKSFHGSYKHVVIKVRCFLTSIYIVYIIFLVLLIIDPRYVLATQKLLYRLENKIHRKKPRHIFFVYIPEGAALI